jgi:hypothetical protein
MNGAQVPASAGNYHGREAPSAGFVIPAKEPTLWEMYLNANRKRPLLTKMITTGKELN